jgi:hypothetical protein
MNLWFKSVDKTKRHDFRLYKSKGKTQRNSCKGLDMSLVLQEVDSPRVSRKSANESGRVVSPTHRLSLSPQDTPRTNFG